MQRKVALVTGANKGIGLATVAQLAKLEPSTLVLLGSRDLERGQEAVRGLQEKENLQNVQLLRIDLDDEAVIKEAAESVRKEFGGLDVLINNAGMAYKGDAFNEEVARTTINTNFFGTLNVCDAFLPLIRPYGRVVNVSSRAGSLKRLQNDKLREQFTDETLTIVQHPFFIFSLLRLLFLWPHLYFCPLFLTYKPYQSQLCELMNKFVEDVKNERCEEEGWPRNTYGVSKAGVSALTRVLARQEKREGILINACCPGWCRTDMAGPSATRSAEQGAEVAVWLATRPKEETRTGMFFADNEPIEF
ncbi:NADH-cytochrome b5 reductase [Balamuthia mandrillaris]